MNNPNLFPIIANLVGDYNHDDGEDGEDGDDDDDVNSMKAASSWPLVR